MPRHGPLGGGRSRSLGVSVDPGMPGIRSGQGRAGGCDFAVTLAPARIVLHDRSGTADEGGRPGVRHEAAGPATRGSAWRSAGA